jgi:Domain of Unknown Function with PDB structure (DUF3857)
VSQRFNVFRRRPALGVLSLVAAWAWLPGRAQQSRPEQAKPIPATELKTAELPAKIGLLDTRIRIEANGDVRKAVHTRIHINNELGVRQFSRLNFDYNRAYQQIEIPGVHITHVSGGSADILPSAVTDQPNPAVVDAPAYQDVRIKSVRILGLAPGDALEYEVITTTKQGPFAPNFYLAHDFASEGLAITEIYELDLPTSRAIKPWTLPGATDFATEKSGEAPQGRTVYRWKRVEEKSEAAESAKDGERRQQLGGDTAASFIDSDVVLTSFSSWADVAEALQKSLGANAKPSPELKARAEELTRNAASIDDKLRALYDFASQKLVTIDLPLGSTGFGLRPPEVIVGGKYAIPEEKCSLLYALARSLGLNAKLSLPLSKASAQRGPAIPSVLSNIFVVARGATRTYWLDPSVEVAPFGMIAATVRGKPALLISLEGESRSFDNVPKALPFAASQKVTVDATLALDGTLRAKVHYTMRGENELLLRVAFHQAAREKWKDVAQLMSLSDGFRGKILSASASDPYDTRHPFSVDYEITQPKFVDWSKQPVRIPAMLPLLGLPDPPGKSVDGAAAGPIELGTPLNVDTKLTLHVPPNVSIAGPTGTSVERDYATFVSHYAAEGSVIFVSRHINFLMREVPAARAADYNAFLHAVQTDQAQLFTLDRANPTPPPNQAAATPGNKP